MRQRRPRTTLELNLGKDIKKGFLKYISNKRKTKDDVSLSVPKWRGDPGNRGCRGGRVPECLYLDQSVLDKTSPQGSLAQETGLKECWKEEYPLATLSFQGELD